MKIKNNRNLKINYEKGKWRVVTILDTEVYTCESLIKALEYISSFEIIGAKR